MFQCSRPKPSLAPPEQVDMFDFSERNSMRHAAEVVCAVDDLDLDLEAPMLVLPVPTLPTYLLH